MPTDKETVKRFDEHEIAATLGEATDLLDGLTSHGASREQRAALVWRVEAIAAAAARAVEVLKGADGNAD